MLAALPEVDDDGRVAAPEERRTSPRTSPRSSPRPTSSPRTCFGMAPTDDSDVAASKRPCLNPASKRPYERPSLTEVNGADPEDDAELICRPKSRRRSGARDALNALSNASRPKARDWIAWTRRR